MNYLNEYIDWCNGHNTISEPMILDLFKAADREITLLNSVHKESIVSAHVNSINEQFEKKQSSPLDIQVGGGHYKSMPIQPVEFAMKNNLNTCQANVVKYVTRYKDKKGRQDLEKAKHYIDLLIQIEEL